LQKNNNKKQKKKNPTNPHKHLNEKFLKEN
jgi:hypothetical protein